MKLSSLRSPVIACDGNRAQALEESLDMGLEGF
jgi:hypothetical protein